MLRVELETRASALFPTGSISRKNLSMAVTDDASPREDGWLARTALKFTAWAERWFPDAFVFVGLAVAIVALAALLNGAPPLVVAKSFGDGFWSLVLFTMQLAVMMIGGYVLAVAPPVERGIERLASIPRTGRGAVVFIGAVAMLVSMLNWAMSLIFGALLARACARRTDIHMDYRAAGAAAYLGVGATWAFGIGSAAAQFQANPTGLPASILNVTGIIPLTQTIFLWQSLLTGALFFIMSIAIAWWSVPSRGSTLRAQDMGVDVSLDARDLDPPSRPGEWLEYSPILTVALVALGGMWLVQEFATRGLIGGISNLNTYNFIFIMMGLLLHWRPRSFLAAVQKSVPSVGGVLVQFPFYGGIAAILTNATNAAGVSVTDQMAHAFASLATQSTYTIVMGFYSIILGLFIPAGGARWILAASHVMQAANDLKVHLGWAVQAFNAVSMSNLINPFFMLPLLGVLRLKPRDIVGYTFLQFLWHVPIGLFLFWLFAHTLTYMPPVMP